MSAQDTNDPTVPSRQIRAVHDKRTVRVYQAYSPAIADAALAHGAFVAPFKRDRMTWIKPSLAWMMYRSGWATKVGQERVLAIDITREGFEWALAHSCPTHFDPLVHDSESSWRETMARSPVRVQWDPERGANGERLDYRSIQVGLSGEAVERYVDSWTRSIEDITDACRDLRRGRSAWPSETVYELPERLGSTLGIG